MAKHDVICVLRRRHISLLGLELNKFGILWARLFIWGLYSLVLRKVCPHETNICRMTHLFKISS